MHSSVRHFPCIQDKMEGKKIWPFFDPHPLRKKFQSFTVKNFVNQNTSAAKQVKAPAARKVSDPLTVADYQPLDAFSVSLSEDGGSTSWSEADDICEFSIRMKEIELRIMMGETLGVWERKYPRRIMPCMVYQTTRNWK